MSSCATHAPKQTRPQENNNQLQTMAAEMCVQQRGSSDLLPPKPFKSDGCSLWPDADWGHCCVEHDIAYWCGGSSAQRTHADEQLRSCVADAGHAYIGQLMELGVHIGGTRLLPTSFRWGYGWPWLSPMTNSDNQTQNDLIQLED